MITSRILKVWPSTPSPTSAVSVENIGIMQENFIAMKCEAKVRYSFPGGTYKSPKTIFDLLEDEGITIPEELHFFPYRATYDFESMFSKDELPTSTEKLAWESKHVPVSVSVCSNVPEYDQPRCFISDGDSKELVRQMVEYLVEMSKESYRLMVEQFGDVLTAIDEKITSRVNSEENENGEGRVDGHGDRSDSEDDDFDSDGHDDGVDEENDHVVDVLESDDDDEEEIDEENDEDRAFIDDGSDGDEDPNFYRALDQELGETVHVDRRGRDTDSTKEKKRQHPLIKLKVIYFTCLNI